MADTNLRVRLQHAYKTEAEWEATTTIPKAGEILLTKDGLHKNWRKTGDGVHRWSELEYDKPTYNYSEIEPIKSKTFSNVYVTENADPAGYLYFMTAKRGNGNYYVPWMIHYRVHAKVNNITDGYQYSDVYMYGNKNTYYAYNVYNIIPNSNYRPYYQHMLICNTEAGVNNGYGSLIGLRFQSAYDPTTASHSREITIEVLEELNCEATFLDNMTLYANAPGTGSTNYGSRYGFDGITNGINSQGDRNNYNLFTYSSDRLTAGSNKIFPYTLMMRNSDGRWESIVTSYSTGTTKTRNTHGFCLDALFYNAQSTTVNENALTNTSAIYESHYAIDSRYSMNTHATSGNAANLVANKSVYLVGTLGSDGLFYLDANWYTQTLPSTEDGKLYMYVGEAVNVYQVSLHIHNPVFYYKEGRVQEYIIKEATPTSQGLMSASDKEKLDIFTMAETSMPAAKNRQVGWYRIAKISDVGKGYANFTLYLTGHWASGAPTVGQFSLVTRHTLANITQLNSSLGTIFTKIRLVNTNTTHYYVDLYNAQSYTSDQTMAQQTFKFVGIGNIETYQPESPLTGDDANAEATALLEFKNDGMVANNFYGNATSATTATTATTANRVSGVAGATNADRHVWFSDSSTETVRNYDDDFKYNPNTNTLKVSKIDGTQLTGTPTAPTAANGTNTTQIATTAFVQNAVGNTEIGGRNLLLQTQTGANPWRVENGISVTTDPATGALKITSTGHFSSRWGMYQDILIEPNTTYTLSCQLANGEDSTYCGINLGFTDNDAYSGFPATGTSNKTSTFEYKVYSTTSTNTSKIARIYVCVSPTATGGYGYIKNLKLEKGNKPTDWTPAPEDLVSSLSLSDSTLAYNNPMGTQLGTVSITKSTVGLGNVDNTSDANKPISTATQTALDQITNTIGNAKLFTGTCSTAAGTAEKDVTCTAFKAADLVKGAQISVYFENTNSANIANLKLDVNSTGAKPIKHIYNGSYANIPGAGYLKAGQIYTFTYDGTNWVVEMMYNSNTNPDFLSYRNNTYAKKAIAAQRLIVGDKDGYEEAVSGVTFDLSYPILYTTGAVAQGNSNYANMMTQYYDINLGNIKSGFTSSAKKMIYLIVTISGNTATVDSNIITDTLPSTDDGKAYITLGRLGAQSTGANYFLFQAVHPIFVYRKGALRLYSGSADIVNGHTVEADVPSTAVFTDTKVTQTLSSTNADYPLIFGKNTTSTTTNYTDTVLRNNSIYANPSTGIITAPILKSNKYLQIKNQGINVASTYSGANVDEIILYTGIKFVSGNLMPKIHITGYAYGFSCPIDLAIVFYIYNNKICSQGVVDNGSWHPNVYLFKYTKDSVDYIAVALRGSTYVYYPTVSADIINEALGKLTNIDLSLFNFQFTAKDADSVIPETDGGTTCIEVSYKTNYNPKPTLTFQMAGTNSAVYNGTETATFNVTKAGIGLGNVENKSSATIRGELTAGNVTTALGYTPANVTTLNGYIPYGGNDNGLGSGTTAEKAKEYFADATKIPNGKVKFYYNNSGSEYTTIFSKAPNASYGSVIKWGYYDNYFRILRYSASNWATDDWEKMDAGYADSAGYTLSIANSALSTENVDTFIENGRLKWGKIGTYDIGWGGKDGFIISIPWSANFARQIAYDDQSTWTATRAMNNGTWSDWDRIVTKTYGDTLYIPKGGPVNSDLYTNSLGGSKVIFCKDNLVTTSTPLVDDANTNLTTSTNISEWLKALLKQICIEYPNYTDTIFRGWLTPSSRGYYEVFIYNTNNVDSTTGLPQYSYGTFRRHVNTYVVFSTNSYTYSQESLVTHSNWTNWITTSSIGAIPLTGSTSITGHLITRGTGEVQIGVGYTTENTARKLYLWGNNSSGSRGLYDDKRGYVINVTDTGVTFTGALSGNATTATNLTTLKSTTSTSLGSIDSFTTNTHGYVSGLTRSDWNYQQTDGAMYGQFYSATWQHQIYGDYRTGQISLRGKNNGTWQDWRRVLDESNYNTIIDANKLAITVTDLSFGTKGLSGTLDPITAYNIGPSASNKTFGLPAEAITVEYSTDAGATWQDYGLSDYSKKALFAETREQWIYAGKNSTSGQGSTNYWLRVTIYPSDGRYAYINGLYLWVNRAGVTATVDLQRSTRGNPDVFTEVFSGQDIAGWSGNNIRYFSSNSFGGGTDQTSNGYKYRMIFKITSITNANYGTLSVSDIRFLGSSVFSFPSGNYMMKHNRLYNWDADLNATFPAKLIASIIQAPIIQTGTDSTSYFQSQKFRGQGDANTYYHAIDFGYTGHNQVDFYEYGGIYNFWKNTGSGTSSAILLGKITTNGWEGNVVGHASLDLPLTGGQLTGDLTLYASSGNSPAIIFQRGTDSDTLTDWKIIDSSGNLLFQCRDSSATNNAWTTRLTLGYSGTITATTFSGALTGHASLDLPLTAGSSVPLSNSLYITKAGECGVEVNNTQETNPNQVAFIVGSSGNGGIYSRKHNKWIVYANASGDVVLNGNATSATTATTATYLNIVAGNELRFASKPSSAVTLHVGYKWHDGTSDAKINRYKFCNGNAALAEVEASTFYGSLSGNATTANEAKALITLGDKRSVATTPNDYTNKIVFAGLKAKATVNNPSSDTYSYVIGLRGWNDSSGGNAYEFALNNSGINYRLENTNTTWNSWNAIAHAPNGGVGDAGTPVYMDTDGTLKETQLKLDDIDPICSKTYTGLYGSANDAAGASFYFATIKPNNYYGVWKIKYRIKADVPNQSSYHGYSDVEIYGKTNTYINYLIFNSHFDTSYRTYYYHNLYRATEAGSSAYGHLLGIGLRTSKESTNSSYPRTVTVEVIEAENCTVTMLADPVKYTNAPGTGATNYAGLTEFDGYTNGLVGSKNDANDTYTVRDYYTRLTAGTNGMKQYSLVMQDANGTWQSFTTDSGTGTSKTKNTVGFQLGKIYYIYTGSNYASGTTCGDNIVTSHAINLNFQYSSNCGTSLVAYKPLYIKGTYNPSDGLFYLADTWWTQDLPTTEDGFIYKQIGYARTSYNYEFSNTLPTYWYKDGAIREFIVPEATQTVSGLLKSTDKVKLDTLSSTYVSKSGDTMTGSLILESYQDEFMAIDTNIIFKDQSANDDIWCISYSGSSLSIADQTTNHKFEFNNDGEMSVASIQIGSSNAITSIKNLTAKGSLSWVSQTDDKSILINSNTLAYWDGSFNTSHNSNLIYCNKGAFGSIVTKNTGDYIPISGSTSVTGTIRTTGNLETRGASETRIGVGYKTEDTERLFYLWGNNSVGTRGIYDTKKGYVIVTTDTSSHFYGTSDSTSALLSASSITSNSIDDFISVNQLTWAHASSISGIGLSGNDGMVIAMPYSVNSTSYGRQFLIDDDSTKIFTRYRSSNSWKDWDQVLTRSVFDTLGYLPMYSTAIIGEDLDSFMTKNGFQWAKLTNATGLGLSNNDGMVFYVPFGNSYNSGRQFILDDDSNKMFTRYKASGSSWTSSWDQILTKSVADGIYASGDFVSKSGDTMTGELSVSYSNKTTRITNDGIGFGGASGSVIYRNIDDILTIASNSILVCGYENNYVGDPTTVSLTGDLTATGHITGSFGYAMLTIQNKAISATSNSAITGFTSSHYNDTLFSHSGNTITVKKHGVYRMVICWHLSSTSRPASVKNVAWAKSGTTTELGWGAVGRANTYETITSEFLQEISANTTLTLIGRSEGGSSTFRGINAWVELLELL